MFQTADDRIEPAEIFRFTVESKEPDILATWTVPTDPNEVPYFTGHFPGRPVLPAVAVLDATLACLRQATGETRALASVVSAKFTAVIEPGRAIRVRATQSSPNEWTATWTDRDRDERLAEVRLSF